MPPYSGGNTKRRMLMLNVKTARREADTLLIVPSTTVLLVRPWIFKRQVFAWGNTILPGLLFINIEISHLVNVLRFSILLVAELFSPAHSIRIISSQTLVANRFASP